MALDHKNENFEDYCCDKFNVNVLHITFLFFLDYVLV